TPTSLQLQAVLFDLDGTLMDHDAARATGLQRHLAEWLPDAPAHELERLDEQWRELEALHYDEYASGQCSFAEQRRRRVRGMHDTLRREAPTDATADAWFAGYLRHYRAQWRAFDDVLPALEALAAAHPQLVLGVVTNGEGAPQRRKLEACGVAGRFAHVIASGEVGVAKPDAAIFALACERLGVEQGQTAHVGDRLDLDAHGAAAAGLRGVWLDRPGAVKHAMPEPAQEVMTISTLHELADALAA
ncbi:MAG TPA: HAD family hydrolase, partial [Polyangiaceae bacterium]|nr:HAD family hydrolase [Polyangiaceae bacterium]